MRDKDARYCHVSMSFSTLGGVCWEWCRRGPDRTVAIYCKVSGAQRLQAEQMQISEILPFGVLA